MHEFDAVSNSKKFQDSNPVQFDMPPFSASAHNTDDDLVNMDDDGAEDGLMHNLLDEKELQQMHGTLPITLRDRYTENTNDIIMAPNHEDVIAKPTQITAMAIDNQTTVHASTMSSDLARPKTPTFDSISLLHNKLPVRPYTTASVSEKHSEPKAETSPNKINTVTSSVLVEAKELKPKSVAKMSTQEDGNLEEALKKQKKENNILKLQLLEQERKLEHEKKLLQERLEKEKLQIQQETIKSFLAMHKSMTKKRSETSIEQATVLPQVIIEKKEELVTKIKQEQVLDISIKQSMDEESRKQKFARVKQKLEEEKKKRDETERRRFGFKYVLYAVLTWYQSTCTFATHCSRSCSGRNNIQSQVGRAQNQNPCKYSEQNQ